MATNSAGVIDIETILRSYGKTMDRKIWKLNNMSSLNINHMLSEVDITSYGRAYILFTRPDLNLFSDNRTTINQDIIDYAPVLHSSIMRNPAMAYMLQSSTRIGGISSTGTANGFMNILNNQCVSCNVPGMKLSLRAASKNSKQYGVSYGGELYEALGETDIQAEFFDTKDRDIQTLMEIWTLYIEAVSQGRVSPKSQYIVKGKLDYVTSIYIFILDESNNIMNCIGLMSGFPISQSTQILNYKNTGYSAEDFVGPVGYDFHMSYVTRPNDPVIFDNVNNTSGFTKYQGSTEINYKNSLHKKLSGGYVLHTGTPVFGTVDPNFKYVMNIEEKFADMIGIDYQTVSTGVQHWTFLFLSKRLGA